MPAVGRIVRMGARARHDGTFTAGRVHQRGRTRHARVHGTVSFVDRRRSAFVVSGHGASIVVGAPQQPLPAVGKDVVADVDLGGDDDDVEASHVQEVGEDHGLEIEGTITAIDAAARKLTVTADDEDELQGTLTVTVPATIDIAQFKVGDEVELKVALQPDGSYLLTKAETEDDEQGDDDDEDHGGQGGDGGDD
jgi:Cu/Ag efflux protein CusF